MDKYKDRNVYFLEIGVGSGVISNTLLSRFPNFYCVAIDISQDAIELTHKNSEKIGVQDRIVLFKTSVMDSGFYQGIRIDDTYSFVDCDKKFDDIAIDGCSFDFIVSNPPYVKTSEMKDLQKDILDYEDWNALHGGKEGLDIIDRILESANDILSMQMGNRDIDIDCEKSISINSHVDKLVWLETHHEHADMLRKKEKEHKYLSKNGLQLVETFKDFDNQERFICLKLAQS